MMSKNKPKETIEFVIRLQDKERQLLEDALLAQNFNKVATPVVAALSDVSFWATLTVLLGVAGIAITPPSGSRAAEVSSWSAAVADGLGRAKAEATEGEWTDRVTGLGKLWVEYFSLPGFAYQAGRVYG